MAGSAPNDGETLRVDRWLWCARLYRARTAAAEAVKGGHVRVNGQRIKASYAVKAGDALSVARGDQVYELEVLAIPVRRGPASEAAQLYEETTASIERRRAAREQRRFERVSAPTVGRPDKTTRRLIRDKRRGA